MGNFGKWLETKDPVALNELAGSPMAMAPAPTGSDDAAATDAATDANPADKAAEQKLSATIEMHLKKLIADLDKLKSRKMKAAILVRVLQSIKDGGIRQNVAKQLLNQTFA